VANQISSASLIATLSDIARSNKRADKHQKNISGKNKYYYENKKNAKISDMRAEIRKMIQFGQLDF
jgi:hypothetical protein